MITVHDWSRIPPPIAAVNSLQELCVEADGSAPFSGHVVESVAAAFDTSGQVAAAPPVAATSYRAITDGAELVGLAVRPGTDPAELAVAPSHRGRGMGLMLLDGLVHRSSSDAAPEPVRVWAHGDLPAARGLVQRLELHPVRTLLQLRRSPAGPELVLPGVPSLPPGVTLRAFVPGQDDDAFLAVNRRAFAWHPEQSRLDRAGLRLQCAQDWFDPAGFFLAVVDADPADIGSVSDPTRRPGSPPDSSDSPSADLPEDSVVTVAGRRERILGFHWTKIHAVDPTPGGNGTALGADAPPIGEVYVLGVDPLSPVRGLGEPLTVRGLQHLAERGVGPVMLYVEGDNMPALRLYERLGFHRYLTDVVYQQ